MARALSLLLSPANAVLRRLRLGAKLALLALVLVAPAVYAANAFRAQQGAQIDFSAKERVGVEYVEPAGILLDRIAAARAAAEWGAAGDGTALAEAQDGVRDSVAAVDAIDSRLGAELKTTATWRETKAGIEKALASGRSRDAWNAATTATVGLIVAVGDGSNLILDPDLDSFYVMDAVITKLPAIVDAAGRAGGIAAAGSGDGGLTVEDRIAIAIEKGATANALSAAVAGLQTSRKSTADAGLAPAITGPVAKLQDSATPLDRGLAAAAGGRLDARAIRAAQDDVLAQAAALRTVLVKRLDILLAQRVDRLSGVRTRVLAVTAAGILLAAWLFVALLVALTGAVRTMVRLAEAIADGDVEQELAVEGRDELSALARAFSRMIAYLRAAADAAGRIARGDLSQRIEPASERDALGTAFARMTDDLRDLVGQVAGSAGRLGQASREMADASEETGRAVDEIAKEIVEVADGAREQAAAVERSRDTAQAIAGSTEESGRRAASTRTAVDAALTVARDGERALGAVVDAMAGVKDAGDRAQTTIARLDETSGQIGGITQTVRSLAEQTNLLALNAAIEAARAGEHGRGFAVVADEVRSLADETDRAGAQIAELVEKLQGETHESVDAVSEGAAAGAEGAARVASAREAFAAIAETVQEVASGVQDIAGALDELAASTGEVQAEVGTVAEVAGRASQTTEHVSSSAQQTSASAQQVAASARELAGTAEHLEQLVERFVLQPAA